MMFMEVKNVKNKKGEFPIMGLILPVIVGMVLLAVVWSLQIGATTYEENTDSWTVALVPVNVSLSMDIPIALVSITNSTGDALAASNYTDAVSDGYVTMLDNTTDVDITYTHQQDGYIGGLAAIVVGFIAVFMGIGLIVFLVGRRKD